MGLKKDTLYQTNKHNSTQTLSCQFSKDTVKAISWKLRKLGATHTASNLGHSAVHSPDVENEEETRSRDGQLQFTPVSYEVCHSGQQNVAKAKEVVSDYPGQHPLL